MQTWCLCCCCPCCGEVSGSGSWKPAQVGEGLQLQLRLCVPPGSLQENPGYELRLKESVTVQEGLCVHVPCAFSYPWNPRYSSGVLHIYWYRSGDDVHHDYPVASNNPYKPARTETSDRFRLLEDPRTNSCSLSISNARRSDTGSYFFRVERGYYLKYSYTDKKLHLQVTGMAGPRRGPGTWDPCLRTGTGHWNAPCQGLGGVVVGRHTGPGVSSGPEAWVPLRVTLWVPTPWGPGTASLLLCPHRGTRHPRSGASGVRPPHTPDLQPARVLRRGKTSDLLLGGGRS